MKPHASIIFILAVIISPNLKATDSFELTVPSDQEWQQLLEARPKVQPLPEPQPQPDNSAAEEVRLNELLAEALTDAVVELIVRPHWIEHNEKTVSRQVRVTQEGVSAVIEESRNVVHRTLVLPHTAEWRTISGRWAGNAVSLQQLKELIREIADLGHQVESLHVAVSEGDLAPIRRALNALDLGGRTSVVLEEKNEIKLKMKNTKEEK